MIEAIIKVHILKKVMAVLSETTRQFTIKEVNFEKNR